MSSSTIYECKLWKVLEKEGLADLSQFHTPQFFDEVPLYSRLADISFLLDLGMEEANAILVRFSVKYLNAVLSYKQHRTSYFAAITVWSFAGDDPIVPNLFVWFGALSKLKAKLALHPAKTKFGKAMKRLTSELRRYGTLELLEDTSTTPEASRVFLGPLLPPYPTFIPFDTFRKPVSQSKR